MPDKEGIMGKGAKKIIKYIHSNIPEDIAEILGNADENDLKILVALMMAADSQGEVDADFSVEDTLGLTKAEVDASLKFWRGAGVIGGARTSAPKTKKEQPVSESLAKESIATAHREGAVETSANLTSYGSSELATLFERRKLTAEFIDEAQRVFGKTFNSYDTGIVAGLVDRLGFDDEAVLAILAYVTRVGKKGLRYAEKVALALYDDGYTTARDVAERIALIERSKEEIYKIKQLFGMGGRELSKTERTIFEKWTQKFEYDLSIVRLAYDITVDAIQKPVPKYADSILEKWYAEGLRTAEAIEKFEKSEKAPSAEAEKSYDLDDFFEAALKRSFDDLK